MLRSALRRLTKNSNQQKEALARAEKLQQAKTQRNATNTPIGGEASPFSIRLRNVAILAGLGGGVYYGLNQYQKAKFNQRKEENSEYDKAKAHFQKMENIDIGGQEFSLVNCKDPTGARVTFEDFRGKWHLVYFGFTHCPDICPSELEKMTDVLTILDEDVNDTKNNYNQIVPVFITIDPSRDSPKCILEYLKDYHPRYLALTGSEQDILNAAKGLRVYFTKGPVDADGDYILDHTLITYLIAPDGSLCDFFGTTKYVPSQLVTMIKEKIDFYNLLHGHE